MTAGAVPLGELLLTLRRELVSLHGIADDVQAVIGAAFERAPPDLASWQRAQSLDLLTQSLHGLAAFVLALAPALPAEWRVDPAEAAGRLALADLARRLAGGADAGAHEAGAVEMF